MRVLIVGFSTRALAESAVRTDHDIVTLDYFGDRDQQALVENYSLKRDFDSSYSAEALARASRDLHCDGVVYGASLENHPALVADLAKERRLLGNEPDVLSQVRDWRTLRSFCRAEGIPVAETVLAGEEGQASPSDGWLRKPVRGGGGRGIRVWDGEALDDEHVLQAYVGGQPASAAFVGDGKRSVLIGVSEQVIGRRELGARDFTWCGNILPLELSADGYPELLEDINTITSQLTRRFGLCGVNGIDFAVTRDSSGRHRPVLLEVNPRYTASMELVERACRLNVFSLHMQAMEGQLPTLPRTRCLDPGSGTFGKAIVYARGRVTMPETDDWVELGRRDVPHPGEKIEAGHPICTVFARGISRRTCWAGLLEETSMVRQETGDQTPASFSNGTGGAS